jgi:hypothetical protein
MLIGRPRRPQALNRLKSRRSTGCRLGTANAERTVAWTIEAEDSRRAYSCALRLRHIQGIKAGRVGMGSPAGCTTPINQKAPAQSRSVNEGIATSGDGLTSSTAPMQTSNAMQIEQIHDCGPCAGIRASSNSRARSRNYRRASAYRNMALAKPVENDQSVYVREWEALLLLTTSL